MVKRSGVGKGTDQVNEYAGFSENFRNKSSQVAPLHRMFEYDEGGMGMLR